MEIGGGTQPNEAGESCHRSFRRIIAVSLYGGSRKTWAFAVHRFPAKVNDVSMKATVELQVLNELGLHARPATEFVRCAMRYPATRITLEKDGDIYTATSILEVLMANLDQGSVFTLEADGPEAEEALQEFKALMVRIRDEEEAG